MTDVDDLSDLQHLTNLEFGPLTPDIVMIEEPVLWIPTLSSCYSHALMDGAFPIFWIQTILKEHFPDVCKRGFRLFVPSWYFTRWPHNSKFIDAKASVYTGVWGSIATSLTSYPILFEHLLNRRHRCRIVFKLSECQWNRTPWNCKDHYNPQRDIQVHFSDRLIYSKLSLYRDHVFATHGIPLPEGQPPLTVLCIDRKDSRSTSLQSWATIFTGLSTVPSLQFKGIHILDDYSFQDQMRLFSQAGIVIYRHGSCNVNVLWMPKGSLVIDLLGGPSGVDNPAVSGRICRAVDHMCRCFPYNTFTAQDITDSIQNWIKQSKPHVNIST